MARTGAGTMNPPPPVPETQHEIWRKAIALILKDKKPLNAEQVKHSDRQERYGAE